MEALFATRSVELEVPAQLSVLRRASAWLNSHATEWSIPETVIHRIDLCLNEVLANCVTHGGPSVTDAPPKALQAALQVCELLEVPANTPLLMPGQSNRNVYIALSGTVVAHLGYLSRLHAPLMIPLGQCIGELSAIDGKPVSTLVMATTEAQALCIPQAVFWGDLMILNGVAENFRGILSDRVRKSKEQALLAQRGQLEVEHLNKELQIARQLQISRVPLQRPLFGHRDDLDICGFMEPASAVDGDFFDAFLCGKTRCFSALPMFPVTVLPPRFSWPGPLG